MIYGGICIFFLCIVELILAKMASNYTGEMLSFYDLFDIDAEMKVKQLNK